MNVCPDYEAACPDYITESKNFLTRKDLADGPRDHFTDSVIVFDRDSWIRTSTWSVLSPTIFNGVRLYRSLAAKKLVFLDFPITTGDGWSVSQIWYLLSKLDECQTARPEEMDRGC